MNTLFREVVRQHTQETAIIFGNQKLTYGELDRLSDAIAQLILESGHKPADCPFVGLYSSRSLYTIPMMIGIWKAGFAYVPMDPKYSSERIGYILDDCKLRLILTDCNAPVADYPQAQWLSIDADSMPCEIRGYGGTEVRGYENSPFAENRYAYAIYTSGTTGKPKGTPITQAGLRNLIEARKQLIPKEENSVEMCISSIVFDLSVWEIFCPLMTGTAVYFISEQEKNDPQRIADLLEEQHITTFNITPTHLSVIPYRQFPELKYLVFAGEPCPEPLVRKWQQTCTVIDAYGPTEATVIATACILDAEGSVNNIGLPLQGVTCYVLDEQLRQVPQGEKGELYIGGIQLTDGYLHKEELNRQKFIVNPFTQSSRDSRKDSRCEVRGTRYENSSSDGADLAPRTSYLAPRKDDDRLYASGDIVYQQPDGHLIYCGRKDSQVKVHGFRIELGEVKTALEQCAQVEAAAVEAAELGEQKFLRAFVKPVSGPLDLMSLKQELRGKLPPYMVPSRLIEVADIPKNINGKTDFRALTALLPSEQAEDQVQSDVERQIAAIWHEVLGITDGLRSDSNFMEVGGDSITIILMMQQLNQTFGILLTTDDVYCNLQLSQLAVLVSTYAPNGDMRSSAKATVDMQAVPLSVHLQNVYVHCKLSPQASLSYNLVELMPFGRSLKKDRLLESWNRLVQLQEALRTTFYTGIDGKCYLRVSDFEPQVDIPEFDVSDDEAVKSLVTDRLSRPYDLEHGPLCFTELYHYSDGRWLLAVYMHHLISDGWSLDEVSQQLYALYQHKEKEVALSFVCYVQDTYQREQGELGEESRRFWDAYQKDVPELKLPGFKSDTDNNDYTMGCVTTRIDHDFSESVHHYCSEHHVSLFSFLSSAMMIVLHRVSRQQQFMIGYPYSGRTTSAQLNTLGYFVHPFPMKFDESLLDMTFQELCQHTMKDIRVATAHPYALAKLPPVSFTLEDMRYETSLGINLPYQLALLTLTVDVDNKILQCRWLYRRSLVETSEIETLSRCYHGLLQQIIDSDGSQPVRSLSMLHDSSCCSRNEERE